MTETPTFLNSSYTSSNIDLGMMNSLLNRSTTAVPLEGLGYQQRHLPPIAQALLYKTEKEEEPMAEYKYRIVQVFIVDTNSSLPVDKAILYRGEQRFTDATDQELFFELDIKGLLEAHNKTRVTYKDKKKSTGVEQVMLEPARVRDLTMNIVDVARF